MLMVCKDANTMSWRQQDENWEKDVRDEVGLDRDVGGWEDKKSDVHNPGEVDEQGGKCKNEKHAGSRVRTWRGGKRVKQLMQLPVLLKRRQVSPSG